MAITASFCSSLEKLFSNGPVPEKYDRITLAKGETGNIQIGLKTDEDCEAEIGITSPLPISAFEVREIYSGLALYDKEGTEVLNNAESGFYPDLLVPCGGTVKLEKNKTKAVWLTVSGVETGEYKIKAVINCAGKKKTLTLNAEVTANELPEQTLKHINWFHSDCISTYYGVEVFSEEYWRITAEFMKNAVTHGVSCLLTPVFTPPLDTAVGGERPTVQLVDITKKGYNYSFGFEKLERWIDTALGLGFRYFEISHLFTQWGAKHAPKIMAKTSKGYRRIFGWETKADSQGYVSFLRQFGKAFNEFTDKKGITDICFVHVSDEPGIKDITSYKKAANVIKEYFGRYKHIDALSDFEFYETGLVDLPVPEEGSIDKFAGKVPELWTYYCCGQFRDNLPNRFFALPSVKNRILGTLLYKYGCKGFLQWGFNFWYSQHSVRPVNPFEETDAGNAFPSGDAFVVYPGEGGIPLSSLRQKVFYDGIKDYEILTKAEEKYGREYILSFIRERLGEIDFRHYPLDDKKLLKFTEEIRKL